ncbi:28185_t:CDS:1, partial [Gigaspora margarita]
QEDSSHETPIENKTGPSKKYQTTLYLHESLAICRYGTTRITRLRPKTL